MTLNQYIRDVQDFPKPGILFKDITPLLANPAAVRECMALLKNRLSERNIDKVVGAESRGFFFATLLAYELNAGFVPVRKPNKLPTKRIRLHTSLNMVPIPLRYIPTPYSPENAW